MVRRGFGLVELLIALTLLGVALLGVAGTTLMAARVLREAAAAEQAAQVALQVFDSLALVRGPSAGSRLTDPLRVSWQIEPGDSALLWLNIDVGSTDGTTLRHTRYRAALPVRR